MTLCRGYPARRLPVALSRCRHPLAGRCATTGFRRRATQCASGLCCHPSRRQRRATRVPVAGAIGNAAGMPASIAVVGGVMVTLGPDAETVTVVRGLASGLGGNSGLPATGSRSSGPHRSIGRGLSRGQLTGRGGEGDRYARQRDCPIRPAPSQSVRQLRRYRSGGLAARMTVVAAAPPTFTSTVSGRGAAPEKAPITAVPDCVPALNVTVALPPSRPRFGGLQCAERRREGDHRAVLDRCSGFSVTDAMTAQSH